MEEGKENERRMRWGQKRSRQRRDGRKEGRKEYIDVHKNLILEEKGGRAKEKGEGARQGKH